MKEEKKFSGQYREDACFSSELDRTDLEGVSGGVDKVSGKKHQEPEASGETAETSQAFKIESVFKAR